MMTQIEAWLWIGVCCGIIIMEMVIFFWGCVQKIQRKRFMVEYRVEQAYQEWCARTWYRRIFE